MPLIQFNESILEGFRIRPSGGRADIQYTKADLPPQLRRKQTTAQEIEDYLNSELDAQLSTVVNDPTDPDNGQTHWDFYVRVKVLSLDPFEITSIVANKPEDVRGEWWL